jgi:hypothetical protein
MNIGDLVPVSISRARGWLEASPSARSAQRYRADFSEKT